MKVAYVEHGIANRYPGIIEVHRKLLEPKYKPLLLEILEHEKTHTDVGYSAHDFFHDLKWLKNSGLYWSFVLSTPSSWVQFSPIYKSRGKWFYDLSLIFVYLFALMVILGILVVIMYGL